MIPTLKAVAGAEANAVVGKIDRREWAIGKGEIHVSGAYRLYYMGQ